MGDNVAVVNFSKNKEFFTLHHRSCIVLDKPDPIDISTDTKDIINGNEGNDMTVPCYSDANPPALYSWYRTEKTENGDRERLLVDKKTDGNLRLFNITSNDTARYTCVASNRPNDEDRSKEETARRTVQIIIRCKFPFFKYSFCDFFTQLLMK